MQTGIHESGRPKIKRIGDYKAKEVKQNQYDLSWLLHFKLFDAHDIFPSFFIPQKRSAKKQNRRKYFLG